MPRINRNELLAGIMTAKGVQSATWPRRVNKNVKKCTNCDSETATHEGDEFCNNCNAFVTTYESREANEGDIVTMQFLPKINPNGMKNWTPKEGGICFNAPTQAIADAIKRRNGLLGVTKMSETTTSDLRAKPRMLPVNDVTTWKAEGIVYEVVG